MIHRSAVTIRRKEDDTHTPKSTSCTNYSEYSTTPLASRLPLVTFSPFALNRSSTVFSLPSWVLSLNQPKWSAIRCLAKGTWLNQRAILPSWRTKTDLFLHFGHWTRTIPFSYDRFVKWCAERSPHPSTVHVNAIAIRGSDDTVSAGVSPALGTEVPLLLEFARFDVEKKDLLCCCGAVTGA